MTLLDRTRRNGTRPRRHGPRISSRSSAAIAIGVIAIAVYLVFGGPIPFRSSPFVLRAVFTANTNLHIPSPVRIAGVDVGTVTGVRRIGGRGDAGVVTMRIDKSGLPIHSDATAAIRSRLFLEGNFFVQLSPGSPSAPVLHSGATLPAANTAGPVQLDRVLSALNAPARANLQRLVQGLGSALNAPAPGGTGAQGLNRALKYSAGAFEASSIVNQALLGTRPHDLSGVVSGFAKIFGALGPNATQLTSLVARFDRTMGVLASRQQVLEQTIALLPGVLQTAGSADDSLNASFGPAQRFAGAILPGTRRLRPAIAAAIPLERQLTALTGKTELRRLVAELNPAARATLGAVKPASALLRASRVLAQCVSRTLVPTGNEKIKDGPATTGLKLYQELAQSAVGLAGASGNFDGNGRFLRASVGGGSKLVQSKKLPVNGPLLGNAVLPPLGARPALPATAPAVKEVMTCAGEHAPQLNKARTAPGP